MLIIMNKCFCNCFIILLCITFFSACSAGKQTDSNGSNNEIPGVAVKVDTKVTAKTDEIIFTITNYRKADITVSPAFKIQKQAGESWEVLPFLEDVSINEIAILVPNDWKPHSYILPVAAWYGSLSEGKYRLLIDIGSAEQVYSEYFLVEGNQ